MQVIGVVCELVNPARDMDGELGRSWATIVLWGSNEQGFTAEEFALRLKMLLAHTKHPTAV